MSEECDSTDYCLHASGEFVITDSHSLDPDDTRVLFNDVSKQKTLNPWERHCYMVVYQEPNCVQIHGILTCNDCCGVRWLHNQLVNSADPDETAPAGAVSSGSSLFTGCPYEWEFSHDHRPKRMTFYGVLSYFAAFLIGMVLFYHFRKRSKDEATSSNTEMSRRRKRMQKQPSIFAILGIEHNNNNRSFYAIEDQFSSFSEVSRACQKAGLERCGLIVGVDFTASNEWQGRKTFSGENLHKIVSGKILNPYQKVIHIMGRTLEPFDDDKQIPAFGFGDSETVDESVFSFYPNDTSCKGFADVLSRYNYLASRVHLSGPTNFAPLIYKAIDIVKRKKHYHILLIIADGQVNEEDKTIEAIVQASFYPLSIVVIGVGDGPWETMEDFDNLLPKRKFDNFQFVNYHQVTSKCRRPETTFALHALMEIPDQYKTIKAMGYLKRLERSNDKELIRS